MPKFYSLTIDGQKFQCADMMAAERLLSRLVELAKQHPDHPIPSIKISSRDLRPLVRRAKASIVTHRVELQLMAELVAKFNFEDSILLICST